MRTQKKALVYSDRQHPILPVIWNSTKITKKNKSLPPSRSMVRLGDNEPLPIQITFNRAPYRFSILPIL